LQKETNPTTLLTGFLGAGKTSLLNHLISSNPDKRYAVIENEFGKENIDSDLVLRGESDIIELNDGCLCCTLNDNLYEILNDLYDQRGEFDELIIEATGVADPVGLAAPFMVHPGVKKQFPLTKIICVVDCEQIEDFLVETEEAMRQIAYADMIVLNKLDLVSDSYIETLCSLMRRSNPLAQVVRGIQAVSQFLLKEDRPIEQILRAAAAEQGSMDQFPLESAPQQYPHRHTSELESLALKFTKPFSSKELQHRLLVFLTFQAKDIFRMKGIIDVENPKERLIVQSVGKRFSIDVGRPWLDEERKSTIVFIGKELDQRKVALRRMLETCLAPKTT